MTTPDSATIPEVVALFVGEEGSRPLTAVERVRAVAGHGLEGDRKFRREGANDCKDGPDRELTLIEAEAIEAAIRSTGSSSAPSRPGATC